MAPRNLTEQLKAMNAKVGDRFGAHVYEFILTEEPAGRFLWKVRGPGKSFFLPPWVAEFILVPDLRRIEHPAPPAKRAS